jgi:hypothetical protein
MAVQAWTLEKNGTRNERWSFTAEGNEGYALNDVRFFRLTEWGCCDWPDVYWYFSPLSGKKLYVSNSDLAEVVLLNSGSQGARYVALGCYKQQTPPMAAIRHRYPSQTAVLSFVVTSLRRSTPDFCHGWQEA